MGARQFYSNLMLAYGDRRLSESEMQRADSAYATAVSSGLSAGTYQFCKEFQRLYRASA